MPHLLQDIVFILIVTVGFVALLRGARKALARYDERRDASRAGTAHDQ